MAMGFRLPSHTARFPAVAAWLLAAFLLTMAIACDGGNPATATPPPTTPPSVPTDTQLAATATPGPSAPTAGTPTATPTPTILPPTATPPPTATAAPPPTPARAPFRTRPPRPTLSPVLREAALEAIASIAEMPEGASMAFDARLQISVQSGGAELAATAEYAGGLQTGSYFAQLPDYSRGELVIATPGQPPVRRELIALFATRYQPAAAGQWIGRPTDERPFPDPRFFIWGEAASAVPFRALRSYGRETLQGVETQVIAGNADRLGLNGLDGTDGALPPGAAGAAEVIYWIGVNDGLLRQVELRGRLPLPPDSPFRPDIEGEAILTGLTVRYSDFGREVNIAAPELPYFFFNQRALLLDDGRVLVAGGFTGRADAGGLAPYPTTYAQLYDLDTGLWQPLGRYHPAADGAAPVFYASLAALPDGTPLAFGVSPAGPDLGSSAAYRLNTDADYWELLADGAQTRLFAGVTALSDGRLLVAGGLTRQPNGFAPDDSAEIFDPADGRWRPAAPMPLYARTPLLLALDDGRALALPGPFSGEFLNGDGRPVALLYDPAADAWEFTGPMLSSHRHPAALVLPDGRALVSGGGNANSELFDPAANQWTPAAPMRQERTGHRLTLLPDGRVIATGGDAANGDDTAAADPPAAAEYYEPAADAWTPGPPLSRPRSNHTATLLPDGRLLLTGGLTPNPESGAATPTNTIEFIQP